ncbi:MAG: hypothetical protein U9N44_06405 [Chloroflexota bacterium]|nr:hypothetical protein [Chloroflexota bacterium]
MKSRAKFLILTMLLPLLAFAVSCGGGAESGFVFNQGQGDCAAFTESWTEIYVEGDTIMFNGSVIAPVPCYSLEASIDFRQDGGGADEVITVTLTRIQTSDDCMFCMGEIPFDGEIGLLADGSYRVVIMYEGEAVADEVVWIGEVPQLTFEQMEGRCTDSFVSSASINIDDDRIMFNGSVLAGFPCYDLKAEMVISGYNASYDGPTPVPDKRITITIAAERNSEPCIKCPGEIPFTGRIAPLDDGLYAVEIIFDGDVLAEDVVRIIDSIQLTFESLEGGCAGIAESYLNIYHEDGTLRFEGAVITPDPCHRLEAVMDLSNIDDVYCNLYATVNITAVPDTDAGEACVQCIGAVFFAGEVGSLDTCGHTVWFNYNGSGLGSSGVAY